MKNEAIALTRIERLLREQFRKPPPGFWGRLVGAPAEYSYRIAKTWPHPCDRYLKRCRLLWVEATEPYLEFPVIPGPHSRGLFFLAGGHCLYLHAEPEAKLARLMRTEQCLYTAPPAAIAALCCDVLLSSRSCRHHLLLSTADLQRRCERRGSTEDCPSIKPISRQLTASLLKLVFYTLSGRPHGERDVSRLTVVIGRPGEISCHGEKLATVAGRLTMHMRYQKKEPAARQSYPAQPAHSSHSRNEKSL